MAARLETLRARLGPELVHLHPALRVEGFDAVATLEPPDEAALAGTLRELAGLGLAALVCGGGSQLGLGRPPERLDALLRTAKLTGIAELDAEEGVARVRAGTRLRELARAARREGLELPLEGAGADSTLGGVLAAGSPGPRFLSTGPPRRWVLGITAVLGDGLIARCGARVVKNVTGYDLARLYQGSLGTLAVIAEAWIRLRALPELRIGLRGPVADPGAALALAAELAGRAGARVAAVRAGGAGPPELVAELAGDAVVVEADRRWLEERVPGLRSDPEAAEGCRLEGEGGAAPPPGKEGGPGAPAARRPVEALALRARFRLAVRTGRVPEVAGALLRRGADLVAHPGTGVIDAVLSVPGPDGFGELVAGMRRLACRGGGNARVEAAPPELRRGTDVLGVPAETLDLMRAVKRRFDPHRVLAPGRIAEDL